MDKKITGKTTLAKILESKKAEKILVKYGVPCLSCPLAKFELQKLKIREICKKYELPLENILKELNRQ